MPRSKRVLTEAIALRLRRLVRPIFEGAESAVRGVAMSDDQRFMREAIELAEGGRGFVSPNPLVGALVVKKGEVIGRGFHAKFGDAHAEVNALAEAGSKAKGATLYVTLEPCCHSDETKKTPPCVPQVIEAGIKRVVVAMVDPNPKVCGKGIEALKAAGIEVEQGVLRREAKTQNNGFVYLQSRSRPFVTAKWAMTLDGKIATRRGDSKWISSEESRALVHQERAHSDAVMVGIGTVLADDPMLTARGDVQGRQPIRAILDPKLALSTQSQLMKTIDQAPVLIYTAKDRGDQSKRLKDAGAEIIEVSSDGRDHLSWAEVLYHMGGRGISSMLLEGGGGIIASAIEYKAVDRVQVFVAPVIIGGKNAVTPVGGVGVPEIAKGVRLKDMKTFAIGPDVYIEGRCEYPEGARKASESGIWRGFRDLDLRAKKS